MSRSRVFKKTIFSPEQLKVLQPKILPLLLELKIKWQHQQINDYEMAYGYLKVFSELGLGKTLWRGLPLAIKETMQKWSQNSWKLVLTEKIPTVEEMLDIQIEEGRYVTIVFDFDFNLEGRDLFSFFLHDLMHAHHFLNDPEKIKGEKGFYRLMKQTLKNKLFETLLRDETFNREFEYLIADMNAFCVHQYKYLIGAIHRYFDRDNHPEQSKKQFLNLLEKEWQIPVPRSLYKYQYDEILVRSKIESIY